ncbi:MAG: zinc ribbon domain-containing protein [Betaproteobacteria bacterium]|nr:zinc ribbon domain-containing protein [Betaproteobacteria bacterium]
MPTYDYLCTQCKQRFEAHHAINTLDPDCPLCGGVTEKVILSAPAMHGNMARGRDLAMRSLQPKPGQEKHIHGPGCGCGHPQHS